MDCEYVKNYYKVPACIGRRIIFKGRPGIIAEDRGHYIGVNFDSDKPGIVFSVHPMDDVEYGELGQIRKMTRSQKRYRDYKKGNYMTINLTEIVRENLAKYVHDAWSGWMCYLFEKSVSNDDGTITIPKWAVMR